MSTTPPITVTNLTRGTAVASAGRVADRFWPRLIGLMLARPLPPGAGLVIVPCSSIHTQFMRFPIDVLYVNKQNGMVGIDRNLRPWRIGRFYKKVHYWLPAGGAALPVGSCDACAVARAARRVSMSRSLAATLRWGRSSCCWPRDKNRTRIFTGSDADKKSKR